MQNDNLKHPKEDTYMTKDREFSKAYLDGLSEQVRIASELCGNKNKFAKYLNLNRAYVSWACNGEWGQISADRIEEIQNGCDSLLHPPLDPLFKVKPITLSHKFLYSIRDILEIEDVSVRINAFNGLIKKHEVK